MDKSKWKKMCANRNIMLWRNITGKPFSPEKSSRNDLGKMHHDLVDFDRLSEEDKRKDSQVGSL